MMDHFRRILVLMAVLMAPLVISRMFREMLDWLSKAVDVQLQAHSRTVQESISAIQAAYTGPASPHSPHTMTQSLEMPAYQAGDSLPDESDWDGTDFLLPDPAYLRPETALLGHHPHPLGIEGLDPPYINPNHSSFGGDSV